MTRSALRPSSGALPVAPNQRLTVAGRPLAILLDLPMAPGAREPHRQLRIAAWNRAWRSQIAFASPEQTGFVQRASIPQAATVGQLLEPLGPGFSGRVDTNTIARVKLFDGELTDVSRLQLLNGGNVAAVRSNTGVWELIQYENAAEFAPDAWQISGLLRGQLGTTDAMAAGAAAGAHFVLIDEAVLSAGLLPAECRLPMNWRVGPAGYDFSDANFVQQSVTGGLRSSLPLAPVHLRGRKTAAGDFAIDWKRCGRIDADSWQGLDIPLGEESETYRIEISAPGGPTVRTAISPTQGWTCGAAQMAADFSPIPSAIDVTVSQLSATAGWGLACTRRLSLG
ncbi:hypothetical protein GCM10007937_46370 [Mesorhizobium albiziae]|nr:hypothetical protein GCM10007937_46370 [Mesorhizobium albiziae]